MEEFRIVALEIALRGHLKMGSQGMRVTRTRDEMAELKSQVQALENCTCPYTLLPVE